MVMGIKWVGVKQNPLKEKKGKNFHLVPMRRMGMQFRMRRIQFVLCASQVSNCLRRRPE